MGSNISWETAIQLLAAAHLVSIMLLFAISEICSLVIESLKETSN